MFRRRKEPEDGAAADGRGGALADGRGRATAKAGDARRTRVVPEPAPLVDDPDWTPDDADATDLEDHFCCCCGHLLGDDPEDEIDGEGPGRDICGNCNRGRNQDALDEVYLHGDK